MDTWCVCVCVRFRVRQALHSIFSRKLIDMNETPAPTGLAVCDSPVCSWLTDMTFSFLCSTMTAPHTDTHTHRCLVKEVQEWMKLNNVCWTQEVHCTEQLFTTVIKIIFIWAEQPFHQGGTLIHRHGSNTSLVYKLSVNSLSYNTAHVVLVLFPDQNWLIPDFVLY